MTISVVTEGTRNGPDVFFGPFLHLGVYAVVTLYFYLGGNAPVLRFWSLFLESAKRSCCRNSAEISIS